MTQPTPLRAAARLGAFAGLATAGLAVAFSGAIRCIDSPVFYYPPALVWAGVGVALLTFGGATVLTGARSGAVLALLVGIVALSVALTGPPFRTCTEFLIGR